MVIKRSRCYGSVTRSWTAARKNGLHLPEEEASPNKQKGLDRASFGDAVMALTEYQVAETRLATCKQCKGCTPWQLMITTQFRCGSMSLDLGENVAVWLPNKPGFGRRFGSGLRGSGRGGGWRKYGGPPPTSDWEPIVGSGVRDFLTSDDVLCMRTTGLKWNIARLYGPFAELFFFLLKKDEKEKPVPPPEWPRLRFD